jgi:hypothetical protein
MICNYCKGNGENMPCLYPGERKQGCIQLTVGATVTKEPAAYFDGIPVPNWPNPLYVGTVINFVAIKDSLVPYAKVKWASGRSSLEHISTLHVIAFKDNNHASPTI